MSADRWGDDWCDGASILQRSEEPPLSQRLVDLSNNAAPPAPNQGAARQARIKRMEHEQALCADFVADCDRYRDALNNYPDPCLTPLVGRLMGRHLDQLRSHAVATGRRLRDELAVLRRTT